MKYLGRHLLAEFVSCRSEHMDNLNFVQYEMEQAALAANATIVQSVFHRFSPYGISGVVVIAESHLAIHTWPEYGYAAIDVFTCGKSCDPWDAINYLKQAFEAAEVTVQEAYRGNLAQIAHEGIPSDELVFSTQEGVSSCRSRYVEIS